MVHFMRGWIATFPIESSSRRYINGKESSKMCVRWGVPQGSVLGPTLFTLFTDDLPSSIKSGDTFMYADDTTVFCIGSSHDVACNLLNCALEELFTWCVNNRLTPHPGKCEVMLLSKARLIGPLPAIYIGKSIIEFKATARLLGVTLDQNLSWIPHLKEVHRTSHTSTHWGLEIDFFIREPTSNKWEKFCWQS